MTERPTLSLEELEFFDCQAPQGARRRFCCPLCGQDKPHDSAHRSLSLEVASGLWMCFRCEAKGKLREKWEERPLERRESARQAMRSAFSLDLAPSAAATPLAEVSIADVPILSLPQRNFDGVVPTKTVSVSDRDSWRQSLHGLFPLSGSPGQEYLKGRGLPLDVCLDAKVKWAPSWMGRPAVVFPIYNDAGVLVAAQGRYIDGRETPKARTLGPKKEGVFLSSDFWSQVKRGAPIIITEAPIDALSLAACGFPALALCGKSGHPVWLPLRCAFKTVVVAFDADDAGEQGFSQLAPIFTALGAKVQRLMPECAKDWNASLVEQGKEELSKWLIPFLLGYKT